MDHNFLSRIQLTTSCNCSRERAEYKEVATYNKEPIRIDYNTELATRGKFARIAIEVNLYKRLVFQFLLDGKIQKAEYKSLPHICFQCGKYGNNRDICIVGAIGDVNLASFG